MAAAEKQWEVHLRTQKMIARRQGHCQEPGTRLRSPERRDVNSIIIKNYPSITEESDKEEENDNSQSDSKDNEVVVEEIRERLPSRHTSGNSQTEERKSRLLRTYFLLHKIDTFKENLESPSRVLVLEGHL